MIYAQDQTRIFLKKYIIFYILLPPNYVLSGWWEGNEIYIFRLLTLQMQDSKFGKDWQSSSREDDVN